MRTYQLNFNSIDDDPFGDGQIITAKSVAELADLIREHVIAGDYCNISIIDNNISTGACQIYHRPEAATFTACIEGWGEAEQLTAELNANAKEQIMSHYWSN